MTPLNLNIDRRDSGWLRLALSILFSLVSIFFLFVGYELVISGATGGWAIVSSFKDWTLYFTSISPGLFVILLGAIILFYGLPKTLKSL